MQARIFVPEWQAVLFNLLDGQAASGWGTMPRAWYLTNALPKMLTGAAPLALLGVLAALPRRKEGREDAAPALSDDEEEKKEEREEAVEENRAERRRSEIVIGLLAVTGGHIGLLSLIGHKEWRFIVYTTPLFNLFAAVAIVDA